MLVDFNPRPRKEGDDIKRLNELFKGISIHALAKRATLERSTPPGAFAISIHALAKRATFFDINILPSYVISIHALAKRATFFPDI